MVDRPAVEVNGLCVAYGSMPVLVDAGLIVPTGTGVCVTGENGIGKSTLLRCVAGLQRPGEGEVRVFGGVPGSTPEFWRAADGSGALAVAPPAVRAGRA